MGQGARDIDPPGVEVFLAGADVEARRVLLAQGLRAPEVGYASSVEDALRQYREPRADGAGAG